MKRLGSIGGILFGNLLLSFHYFLVVYINSSFLEERMSAGTVGLLYSVGSLATIVALCLASPILKRFGNYATTLFLTALEVIALIGLAVSESVFLIATLFIVHQAMAPLILFNLDIFLEKYSKDGSTGRLRAVYLTVANITLVVSPFMAGILASGSNFSPVYAIAALFAACFGAVVVVFLRKFRDPDYNAPRLLRGIRAFARNRNLHSIFMANLLLQIFYAVMVIYIPIYLHTVIGFDWPEIGLMFSIMVLPFLLLELPLGFLADKITGEKELLIAGFVIMAVSTGALGFLSAPILVLWAAALFMTRVGASFIEIMSESYFFKQVKSDDSDSIGLFRMTRPLSFIIAPPIAAVALSVLPYSWFFVLVGVTMLSGITYARRIADSR